MILSSPFVGVLLNTHKRRTFLQLGLFLMVFSLTLNALCTLITNKAAFMAVVIFARITQGLASSLIQTTCFSITGKLYKDQQAKIISILEMAVGFGNSSSPVVGALLFQLGGFMAPFFFYAAINLCFAIILKKVIPDEIDNNSIIKEVLLPEVSNDQEMLKTVPIELKVKSRMGFLDVLRRPKMLFALLCGCLAYFDGSVNEPVLTNRLEDYDISQAVAGVYFAVYPLVYILVALTFNKWPKSIDNRVYMIIGCVFGIFSCLFSGPSLALSFADKPSVLLIGLVLMGFEGAAHMVLALPETLHYANKYFPDDEDYNSNFCSGIFNAFLGFGQIAGPLFGSLLTASIGYRLMYDVAAIINLLICILYFMFGNGFEAFKTSFRKIRNPDTKITSSEQRVEET